ncbi:MAG: flagellar motor protein MotD [Nitrospiraceae bacterium]|nr:MAG: flagellar motor protein MotD [Nitrospiraceae bacterium]
MAKKHTHEEHENHERWLVSYADFITLLFAFFVVMYSVSVVNEGRFRTVSESIKAALHPIVSQPTTPLAFNIGEYKPALVAPRLPGTKEPVIRRLREIVKVMQPAAQFAVIHVMERADGDIAISIPEHVLFDSGSAILRPNALPFLQALAEVLVELDRPVTVEGHTDNVPIRTAQYPSNWELSAARAVVVVRVLTELYGVPPAHAAAIGYADSRPIADNSTAEGRAKNRRVEIVVSEQSNKATLMSTDPANGPSVSTPSVDGGST